MRNYYIEIHEYMEKLVEIITTLEKKGININGFKLSIIEILILKSLKNENGRKMYKTMQELNIDRNTFKTISNRLIFGNYIIKIKSIDDKRSFSLYLTEKGKKILEEIRDKEKELLFSLLDDFTLNEEIAILKFLVKLDMLNKKHMQ